MSSDTTIYTLYPEAELEQRVRFYDGQFLGSQDFVDAHRYHIDRLRRLLDHMVVPGVAYGLTVTTTAAWTLKVSPGTAVDGRGRLVVLAAAAEGLDVPREHQGKTIDVAIVYGEVEDRIQGGSSEEAGTRGATRIREQPGFEFYPAGEAPKRADAVPLARISVAGDGSCGFSNPDPVRRFAGFRLPTLGGAAPILRSGGPVRPALIDAEGSLAVTGDVGIGTRDPAAKLDVEGLTRVQQLHVRPQEFRVGGDQAKFYPIVFEDLGWDAGALTLELTRADNNLDATNAGSMIAVLRCHAPNGNGSGFASLDLHQNKRFIAEYRALPQGRLVSVWLRGDRTYYWRANHNARLLDADAKDKSRGGQALKQRADVEAALDFDEVHITANRGSSVNVGPLRVEGDLVYTGTQIKLDTAAQNAATVRSYDFYLGHPTRRGNPGRALVDEGKTLTLNFGRDWTNTKIGSQTTIDGTLTVAGQIIVDNMATLKGYVTVGAADAKRKLTINGFSELLGDTQVGDAQTAANLRVFGGATVDGNLTAGANGTLDVNASRAKVTGNVEVTGTTSLGGVVTVTNQLNVQREDGNVRVSRANTETTGGVKLFLELVQDDVAQKKVPEVSPAIRFHHGHRFWHRIEADNAGFHIRDGNTGNNDYRDLFLRDINVIGNLKLAEQYTITLPCADFKMGFSTKRGAPGRAFVDYNSNDRKVLCINYDKDWPEVSIHANTLNLPEDTRINGFGAVAAPHETGLVIIRGTVKGDGTIEAGTGFTVAKDSNLWRIDFGRNFKSQPTVVATQQYPDGDYTDPTGKTGNTKDNAIVCTVLNNRCWIKTGDGSGDHSWRRFHFIAIGP